MHSLPVPVVTIGLLILSNIFMTSDYLSVQNHGSEGRV